MKKIDKHIEVVRTKCPTYNTMGSHSCTRIVNALTEQYKHVGVTYLNTQNDLDTLALKRPDLVFMGMKQLPMSWGQYEQPYENIWVSEFLESVGINHTGSPRNAVELDKNKVSAKIQVQRFGLPTAPFFTAIPGQFTAATELPLAFPLFVKPFDDGGGKGIDDNSVVRTFQEFDQKVGAIFDEFEKGSLVEQYLTGREFSVGLMGTGYDAELVAMPVELVAIPNTRGG